MSRAYWVKLTSSVSENVSASDKAVHKIDLEAVVPEGEMGELLEDALSNNGWTKSEDGTFEKTQDDVSLVWDLESMTVEASVERSEKVQRDVQVEGRGYDQGTANRQAEQLLKQREESARDAIKSEEARIQRETSDVLEANEQDRVRDINKVLQETYTEALKRKARKLGNVTSIQESTNDDDYSLTIVISE